MDELWKREMQITNRTKHKTWSEHSCVLTSVVIDYDVIDFFLVSPVSFDWCTHSEQRESWSEWHWQGWLQLALTCWSSSWWSDSNTQWAAWTTIFLSLTGFDLMRHPVLAFEWTNDLHFECLTYWIPWLWQHASSTRRCCECSSDMSWSTPESLSKNLSLSRSLIFKTQNQHADMTLNKSVTVVLTASLLICSWKYMICAEVCIPLDSDIFLRWLDRLDLLHT